jgi:elongation factor Ts
MMDCKKALKRDEGRHCQSDRMAAAKASPQQKKNLVVLRLRALLYSYIHTGSRVGVLRCEIKLQETDFLLPVAREFQTLARNIAMQVTALSKR